MTRSILLSLLLAASALAWSLASASADKRVALVIGNSAYTDARVLNNPVNDANDLANKLQKLDFEVVLGTDLTREQMLKTVREFGRKLTGAETAMVFFAGHAIQSKGSNYLAPVDTKLEAESDLEFDTISLDRIISTMESRVRTLLIFLDACRDNPLARRFVRKSRSAQSGGLARPENPAEGIFIAFATQPGNVALDGSGRNSPFTSALLKHIGTPQLEISSMMTDIRRDVYEATGRQQLPWTNSGLLGRFYFNTDRGPAPSITNQENPVSDNTSTEIPVASVATVKADPAPRYLGMNLMKAPAEFLERSFDPRAGVIVVDVEPLSEASKKSIRATEIIFHAGGITMNNPAEFRRVLDQARNRNSKTILLMVGSTEGDIREVRLNVGR